MHQEHNLPWNLIAQNFKFVKDNAAFTPCETRLFAKGLSSQANELNHFVRTLVQTITDFSITERAKYTTAPTAQTPPLSGKLFTDEIRDKYPDYLNKQNQYIEHWISRARNRHEAGDASSLYYDTGHADLAEVVKVLLLENQLSTLFMLSRHPQIPLGSLRHLSWGHHFGFSRVMEAALRAYLFFNIAAATGTLDNGAYLEMNDYPSLLSEVTSPMDYPAQQLPHRLFFYSSKRATLDRGRLPSVHGDLPRLREYLKLNFALLYRYDALVRECGLNPEWEREIVSSLGCQVRGLNRWEWLPEENVYAFT